ncbi:hypothetical protein BDF21DRAFT_149669 [Thamnidium elegans]|nr:hypothetical protein BDF21DRAFT_149669 [Thamnidium elegans]
MNFSNEEVQIIVAMHLKKNVSKSVIINQQVKNLRDNAAVMIDSSKATNNNNITVNGIDYIGDTDYLYQLNVFEDIMITSSVSTLITPSNLASLKTFGETLNSLYHLKSKLMELSNKIKTGKVKETRKFDLVDAFDTDDNADEEEDDETNVFYASKSKKIRTNEEE